MVALTQVIKISYIYILLANMDSAKNDHAIHEIASKLEKGSQVDIILLDFAKAFDKVPHQHLLHKLEYYGVNAKTKNWIQSFLQNRQQSDGGEGNRSIVGG
jgi:hypothetical protein